MKSLGIIPARYGSTRLPGKPLELIKGKPMIYHVWNSATQSKLDKIVVATDNSKIYNYCKSQEIEVVMTSENHNSGTDRIIEVMQMSEYYDYDVYVNIQGDEPMILSSDINKLIDTLYTESSNEISTLVTDLKSHELSERSCVKAFCQNTHGGLIYMFTRSVFYCKNIDVIQQFKKHIGIYAFQRNVLLRIQTIKTQTQNEIAENLEQLRWLDSGLNVVGIYTSNQTISIDTIEDLNLINSTLI
jgi:3-deoxy-manno-octulosonate cytidylyltransferase (CMP-KDO synthetase)